MTPAFKSLVYFFGALGELMFGYNLGVIGVALLFISKDLGLTAFSQGLVVSSLLAGAAVGAGCAGVIADRHGRRPALMGIAAVFVVGGLLGALAPNVAILIAGRAVMGLGVGASAVVGLIYLSELAPAASRGRIAALGQLMIVCGLLLAYLVDYALAPWAAWRWMIAASVLPSALLFVGMIFMPESPRWLMLGGARRGAREVLILMGREATADRELAEIERALAGGAPAGLSLARRLRSLAAPGVRRGFLVCVVLAVMVQLLGVNTIVYYAPSVLMQVGFGAHGASAANLGIGATNLLLTVWALGAIDRLGRRPLLLIGSAGMVSSMTALSVANWLPGAHAALLGWITLIGMMAFLGSFAMSWGVCVRVVISELLPQGVRGSAMGFVLVLNWLANFCVGLFFPVMLAGLGAGLTFLAFAGVGVAGLAFVAFWVPETKGRTLEEIQQDLRADRGARLPAFSS